MEGVGGKLFQAIIATFYTNCKLIIAHSKYIIPSPFKKNNILLRKICYLFAKKMEGEN